MRLTVQETNQRKRKTRVTTHPTAISKEKWDEILPTLEVWDLPRLIALMADTRLEARMAAMESRTKFAAVRMMEVRIQELQAEKIKIEKIEKGKDNG